MVTHFIVALACAVTGGAYLERVVERTRCGVPAGLVNLAVLVFTLVVGAFATAIVLRVMLS